MTARTRLLVISPWYEPGYKAGGVVRAVVNTVEALARELDISIVTSDRDYLDDHPYTDIVADRWLDRSPYRIFQAPLTGGRDATCHATAAYWQTCQREIEACARAASR